MTRKKYSHERKNKTVREKDINYAPDDVEEDDEDVNDLDVQQLNADYYIGGQDNPFIAFKNNFEDIITKINKFRSIPNQFPIRVSITNNNIINDNSILSQLNTNLILMVRGNVASVYKGVSSKEIQTTLKEIIINFFKKYPSNENIKSNNIEFIPILITPSAVSNFYNMLVRSYKTFKITDAFKRVPKVTTDKNFDEVFSLDDIDLILSFGVLDKNKYYFKIPTKVSNTKIYGAIENIYKNENNYSYYFKLLNWFSINDYKYRLPILLFIDSYHDFSKKATGGKDKVLQTEINKILKLSENSTIMTYYTNKIFNDENRKKEYPFEWNTILQDLNSLPTPQDRRYIFDILKDLVIHIYGKAFEKEFLYLYMYYFYINNNLFADNIKDKLELFQKYYVYNAQESPRTQIQISNYTQDFLMRNESYRKGGKPKHFAVVDSATFNFIPAALMDANKATSSKRPEDYVNNQKIINYNIGPFKILYDFNTSTSACGLSVVGFSDEYLLDQPIFQLYAEQNCTGSKIPIEFDEALDDYENSTIKTIAKKNIYKLNDKLKEIENTLKNRFNIKDIKNLSTRFIKFSNGSDGISRGDVLSLILAFSEKLPQLNIQLLDRLLTLKRLGDFGQIINCKRLEIPLFTQDSMENLLAIITNTSTIFGNNPTYIYFKSNEGIISKQPNINKNSLKLNPKPIIANLSDINYEPILDEYKQELEKKRALEYIKNNVNNANYYYNNINNNDITEELYKFINDKMKIDNINNKSLKTDLAKWLHSRFLQISNAKILKQNCLYNINDCDDIDKQIITKVLNKYIDLIKKIDILEQIQDSDKLTSYLFAKYDLYDLINNFTSGYKYTNKETTITLLQTVLREILYDLEELCVPYDNRNTCKNIDDYLNIYENQLKQETTPDEYQNELNYYKNTFNQMKNKQYLLSNKIRSRNKKKLIKSSRDNLRKQKR
jgi:hypothetical protein